METADTKDIPFVCKLCDFKAFGAGAIKQILKHKCHFPIPTTLINGRPNNVNSKTPTPMAAEMTKCSVVMKDIRKVKGDAEKYGFLKNQTVIERDKNSESKVIKETTREHGDTENKSNSVLLTSIQALFKNGIDKPVTQEKTVKNSDVSTPLLLRSLLEKSNKSQSVVNGETKDHIRIQLAESQFRSVNNITDSTQAINLTNSNNLETYNIIPGNSAPVPPIFTCTSDPRVVNPIGVFWNPMTFSQMFLYSAPIIPASENPPTEKDEPNMLDDTTKTIPATANSECSTKTICPKTTVSEIEQATSSNNIQNMSAKKRVPKTSAKKRVPIAGHIPPHHQRGPHKCKQCPFEANTYFNLWRHRRSHSLKHAYTCSHCHIIYDRFSGLHRHLSKVHPIQGVIDDSKQQRKCRRKIRAPTPPLPTVPAAAEESSTSTSELTCRYCKKEFSTEWAARTHEFRHTKPYKCTLCARRSARWYDIRKHLITIHALSTTEAELIAQNLNKALLKTELRGPLSRKTTNRNMAKRNGSTAYKCSECPYTSYRMAHVTAHRRAHTNKSKYHCSLCSASFKQMSRKYSHVRRDHAAQTDTKINLCSRKNLPQSTHAASTKGNGVSPGQDTNSKSRKQRWSKTTHRCPYCPYVARYHKSDLLMHINRCHNGEKEFKCSKCPASFALRASRSVHFLHVHKKADEQKKVEDLELTEMENPELTTEWDSINCVKTSPTWKSDKTSQNTKKLESLKTPKGMKNPQHAKGVVNTESAKRTPNKKPVKSPHTDKGSNSPQNTNGIKSPQTSRAIKSLQKLRNSKSAQKIRNTKVPQEMMATKNPQKMRVSTSPPKIEMRDVESPQKRRYIRSFQTPKCATIPQNSRSIKRKRSKAITKCSKCNYASFRHDHVKRHEMSVHTHFGKTGIQKRKKYSRRDKLNEKKQNSNNTQHITSAQNFETCLNANIVKLSPEKEATRNSISLATNVQNCTNKEKFVEATFETRKYFSEGTPNKINTTNDSSMTSATSSSALADQEQGSSTQITVTQNFSTGLKITTVRFN